jgi:polysaccharide biosynthesis protein PslF
VTQLRHHNFARVRLRARLAAPATGRLRPVTTRFGFVSTYPPTICGLATFTSSLYGELVTSAGNEGRVIRLVETPQPFAGQEVVGELVAGDPRSAHRAAALLNDGDIAIVQHEYGVYGGPDGDEILLLLRALTVPSVVVLHTVLSAPTPHQKSVLEAVAAAADAIVTMTITAHNRLASGYAVDMRKVNVIPHGAPVRSSHGLSVHDDRPTVLTWGLIGPGKGIEWGIEAMAALGDLYPAPRYVVAGQTHPKVLLRDGEAYRDKLKRQVASLSLGDSVSFDSRYRDSTALGDLVDSADVVLLPYDSTDQVTSGVLIEAVAALKPVIATRFPHAVELLRDGAGLLVPQKSPDAIAAALRTLLTDRELVAGMTKAAGATASDLLWSAVAERYLELADHLISTRVAA